MNKNKIRCGNIIAEAYYPDDAGNGSAIVFCMGLPSKSNFEELARKYVDSGFTFIHPKYIGSWESYGVFSIKNSKQTILSLVHGIKEQKIVNVFGEKFDVPIHKIFLLGHSFGGSVALSAGADLDIAGIIALSPVIDYKTHARQPEFKEEDLSHLGNFLKLGFENVYRGINKPEWEDFCKTGSVINPADYANKLKTKKILLIHGKKDESVNCSRSKKFAEKLSQDNEFSQYIETEDNHSNIKENAIPLVINWVRKLLHER